ncbi:MAG: DUF4139 domain-containing protein [Blastocatellia bacterium]|nr:DUF4139 domain-containing protein [Blastocatellia bacterium]
MRLQSLCAVVLTAALSGGTISGQVPQPASKTTAIAAFKNGLGFFVKQGRATVQDGWALTTPLPSATLGTLWLSTTEPGTAIEEVIATQKTQASPRPVSSVAGLLAANAGQTITIQVGDKSITGELFAFPTEKPNPDPIPFDRTGETMYPTPYLTVVPGTTVSPAPVYPDMLMLKVNGALTAFHMGEIKSFTFPQNPKMSLDVFETTKHLKFKVKGAKDSVGTVTAYLQKGFGWTPSYLVALKDEKTATITMQAVLVNDVEDVVDGEVSFVVGYPNFAFSNVPSPMSGRQSLAQFLQLLQQSRSSGSLDALSNAVITQQAMSYRNTSEVTDGSGFNTTASDMSGTSEEDLFLYKREHVMLKRGERATYPVFSGTVGYEHIYTWDIPDTSRVDIYGQSRGSYDRTGMDNPGDKVWHSVRLKNATDVPWTTAPALVLTGEKPLAQDTLGYTPKGATTDVKLTVATDVRVDKNELEIERQPDIKRWAGRVYDSVTVEGTLKVKNYKSRPVTLCVQKLLVGEVGLVAEKGTAERLAVSIQSVNPTSRIKWELPLAAGEEKTVTYKYKVFVAH